MTNCFTLFWKLTEKLSLTSCIISTRFNCLCFSRKVEASFSRNPEESVNPMEELTYPMKVFSVNIRELDWSQISELWKPNFITFQKKSFILLALSEFHLISKTYSSKPNHRALEFFGCFINIKTHHLNLLRPTLNSGY